MKNFERNILCGCCTDRGSYRAVNQDCIYCGADQKAQNIIAFGVVCDGIGGLDNSELASQFVVKAAEGWFESINSWIDLENTDAGILYSHFRDGAEDWNYQLCQYIERTGFSIGTTMSCILILNSHRYIIHVGDSRIYKYNRDSGFMQLTADAVVNRVCDGRIKSVLVNYMGKQKELWYYKSDDTTEEGDMYFFCSDGFYHNLTESDAKLIYESICCGNDPNEVCREAVNTMISRGEKDNISFGLIYIGSKSIKKTRLFFNKK